MVPKSSTVKHKLVCSTRNITWQSLDHCFPFLHSSPKRLFSLFCVFLCLFLFFFNNKCISLFFIVFCWYWFSGTVACNKLTLHDLIVLFSTVLMFWISAYVLMSSTRGSSGLCAPCLDQPLCTSRRWPMCKQEFLTVGGHKGANTDRMFANDRTCMCVYIMCAWV